MQPQSWSSIFSVIFAASNAFWIESTTPDNEKFSNLKMPVLPGSAYANLDLMSSTESSESGFSDVVAQTSVNFQPGSVAAFLISFSNRKILGLACAKSSDANA